MRALTIMLTLILLSSCVSEKASNKKVSTASSGASQPLPGPTGSSDPVDPNAQDPGDGLTFYDDPFEEPVVIVGDPVVNVCGVLFKDFFSNEDRFIEAGQTDYKLVASEDYGNGQLISQLRMPDDSKDVCLDGAEFDSDQAGVRIIKTTAIYDNGFVSNPMRPEIENYANEFCGTLENYTSFGGASYVQIAVGTYTYIINNINMTVLPSLADKPKACVYSNSAAYNDYSMGFKKYIDVEAFTF